MQHPMVEGGNGGVSLVHFVAVMSHPLFFSLKYVHVRRSQKGDLNSGAVRYVVVCGKTPDPIFCVRGAFLPKAHFVS